MNVLGNLLFSLVALSAANASGVFYWWVLVTMLDVAAALYAVGIEGEDLRLVPYAVLYRFMQVDLLGQCASESLGSHYISSTGGQADFMRRKRGGAAPRPWNIIAQWRR